MHVFALLGMIRRREIGVMRAVGASRGDVRLLFLTEAAFVGAVAGSIGVAISLLIAWMADRGLASVVPDFPFKPETFFAFEPWMIVTAIALAVVSCVLGALAPALRASGPDPAEVLSGD
jgi:ABC-type antimicrobial peptide transport system permease subunit